MPWGHTSARSKDQAPSPTNWQENKSAYQKYPLNISQAIQYAKETSSFAVHYECITHSHKITLHEL